MDGANLNALMGIAQPGKLGPDVLHMNLHKTFCIPHGGGGPGMGPIGLKSHLSEFAPNHCVVQIKNLHEGNTAVSAAPFGSPGILPISWVYIQLMGGHGLKKSSQVAILNANYLAKRLNEHFPIVYTGKNGLVAHECIIDVRPLKADVGISEEVVTDGENGWVIPRTLESLVSCIDNCRKQMSDLQMMGLKAYKSVEERTYDWSAMHYEELFDSVYDS